MVKGGSVANIALQNSAYELSIIRNELSQFLKNEDFSWIPIRLLKTGTKGVGYATSDSGANAIPENKQWDMSGKSWVAPIKIISTMGVICNNSNNTITGSILSERILW